jgi:hypothetical protein
MILANQGRVVDVSVTLLWRLLLLLLLMMTVMTLVLLKWWWKNLRQPTVDGFVFVARRHGPNLSSPLQMKSPSE